MTGERIDPMALRWLIGGELSHLRTYAGLSLAEAAEETGVSSNKLNHLENARTNQTPEDIAKIAGGYGASQTNIDRLVSVASMPVGKPWWNRWRAVVPEWYSRYLGLEGIANRVFAYEVAAVHGLLQTPEYAEDVTRQSNIVSTDNVDRHVALRMSRSNRIYEEPPLSYHAILDEAVFHRKLINPDVLGAQCTKLLEATTLPNVTLQVIPSARGMHGVLGMGNYALLDFDGLNGVAYSELYGDALYIRDPDKVTSYRAAAGHLCDIALSPEETRKFIKDLRRRTP